MIRLLAHRYAMLAATICLCRISIGGDCFLLAADGSVAVFERLEEVSDGLALKDRFEQMYSDLAARQVKPAGWIREFLERQRTGLTGHPEQSGFPFNTQMWAGEMNVRDREHSADGSDWWPYEQTAYYLDGALLFSLPVQAKQMLITDDAGVGKCSPEFPMYCLEPRSSWNFALPENLDGNAIEVQPREIKGYPWDVGNSPVSLRVKGARLVKNWQLTHHIRLPDTPDRLELDHRDQDLVFVPMGSTLLRMSVFAVKRENQDARE